MGKLKHILATFPEEWRLSRPAPLVRGKHPRLAASGARSPREGRALIAVSERLIATKLSHAVRSRALRGS
eukprot:12654164-Alexandrium_andersonii.AAC.1